MSEIEIRKLLDYIESEFESMEDVWVYKLVENTIRYAVDNMPSDMVLYHISEIIPELTADELVAVVDEE